MFKFPNNFKYKKIHFINKKKIKGSNFSNKISFGYYGIQPLKFICLSNKRLILIEQIASNIINKFGKLWITVIPNSTITKKSEKTRMGKGIGKINKWFFLSKPGKTFLELEYISYNLAFKILKACQKVLPIKLKLVKN
jgi:ribosomal protein L16